MKKTLIIMAAGMGSRYGGLKQLDAIGPSGETIMDYAIYDAIKAGFSKLVFVIRKDIEEAFRTQIGDAFSQRIEVEYVFQDLKEIPEGFTIPEGRAKPWGTGHAMLSAEKAVQENFIIINADDYYGPEAFQKASQALDGMKADQIGAALVAYRLKNTLSPNGSVARGVCELDGASNLSDIEETLEIARDKDGQVRAQGGKELADETMVSMNMWAFSPALFGYAKACFTDFLRRKGGELKSEFYIPDIVSSLIKEGYQVPVVETTEQWFGVTYREDKPDIVKAIERAVEKAIYPNPLWSQA